MKRSLSVVAAAFAAAFLLAAATARADVGPPTVSRAERAQIRAAVRANAKTYLAQHNLKLDRPSIRVTGFQRMANGAVKLSAGIFGMGHAGVPTPQKQRLRIFDASFVATPAAGNNTHLTSAHGWQPIFYALGAH